MIEYKEIDSKNRSLVNHFLQSKCSGGILVYSGEIFDLTKLGGMVALEGFSVEGVVTRKEITKDLLLLTSVDSLTPGKGVGTMLTTLEIQKAKKQGYTKMGVITTNDNTAVMEFYQRLGFDMKELRHDAVLLSRKQKPTIPMMGNNSIPIKHEIYFEMEL